MANNYIPGFTPSLHGRPVKRMAIGGRMEGDRLFRERDDTIDYEAVGNPLGNLQNTLSNIDANSVLANYNNTAASQMPTPQTPNINEPYPYYVDPGVSDPVYSYQSQPTPQPVQTAPYYGDYSYDPYNIGNFGLSSYQQSGPTAAQLAARDLELTKPGVAGAEWDPQAKEFVYTRVPIKVTEPLKIQATSPLPPQSQPTTAAPSYNRNPAVAAVRAGLSDEMTITPRQLGAAPVANNGEVSPFTSNPYMVVNYGKDINTPSFENTQNLDPTKSYTLTNPATGQVMAQSDPSDPTSLARLVLQANQLSGNKPTDANWELAQDGKLVASDYPNRLGGVLGALVQYGLPIGLSLIPGLNWLGSAAAAGLGSTAGKLISNYDLGDALKSGLITAGTAGLLKAPVLGGGSSIGSTIGTYLDKVPGVGDALRTVSDVFKPGSSSYNPLTETITTTATKSAAPALIGGGLSSVLGGSTLSNALDLAKQYPGTTNYADQVYKKQPTLEEQFDDVFGAPTTVYGAPGADAIANAVTGGIAGTVPGAGTYYPDQNLIEVQTKNTPTNVGNAAPVVAQPPEGTGSDIVVENKYKPQTFEDILAGAVGAVAPTLINTGVTQPTTTTDSKKSTLDKIVDYLRLAGLASTAIGGLTGGKGGAGAGGYAGMRGPLNPIFSAQLPTANMQSATPRSMAGTDWYRYGYGPEQSFFSHVPQGGMNTSTAYTGYPGGLTYGGGEQYTASAAPLSAGTSTSSAPPSSASTATTTPTGSLPATTDNSALAAAVANSLMQAAAPTAAPSTKATGDLSAAQKLYAEKLLSMGGQGTPEEIANYVKSLSDYQALASLSNYDSLLGSTIYNGPNGYRTMDELEAYYGTPLYTYGGDTPRTSNLPGYAEGGYAVGGPGDGRDDKIPAMLSDGEYVMDAETVALLGNGSPKAGADMLDKFRVNVRKHKGRDLAKGKFSANAKKPEQYLKGRK